MVVSLFYHSDTSGFHLCIDPSVCLPFLLCCYINCINLQLKISHINISADVNSITVHYPF